MQRPLLKRPSPLVPSTRKSLRRLTVAALSACAILVAHAAHAETEIFKDVLRPNGVERSQAQKFADGRACGSTANDTFTNVPAFEKCMRAHGWVVDQVKADATDVDGATYDDMRPLANGQPRGDAALHADGRKCDPSGHANVKSPRIKQCMLNHGWRLSFVIAKPNFGNDSSASGASNPTGDNNVWTDATRRRRGEAAARADSDYCVAQTGPDPVGQETSPALKQCMASRGWRFVHTTGSSTWIDPDTGLSCHSAGIASICEPPQGTVTYYDSRHGLNCRRTGIVSVCTNW